MIRKAILKSFFLASLTWGGSSVQALECTYCEGKDLGELIELSVSRSSPALRAQIRGWIAEKHPDTPAGYVARAWVHAANGGAREEAVRLYKEAIQRDPSLGLAYTNAGYQLEQLERFDEAIELYKQGAKVWPQHAFFVQYAYFNIKKAQNEAAARAFLAQAEQDRISERWVFDYVRGVAARSDGDRNLADRLFRQAMTQGGNSEAFTAWFDNRLKILAAQRASRDTRIAVVREGISWARENREEPALRHIANALSKDFNMKRDAFGLLREAYEMNPTPDAAEDAFSVIGNDDFDAGLDLIERGLREFPDNYRILIVASWAWTDFRLDAEKAESYGKRAIENAPTHSQLYDSIRQYSTFTERTAAFERAVPYFERHLPEMKGRNYRNLIREYVDNRIAARDFTQAARLLDRAQEFGGLPDSWMASRKNSVTNALRLAGQRDRFFAENPFLLDWEQRFGDSLRVTVEFATGKADIRPEGFGVLDRAAEALNAPGGDNYVFLVEGHTDSRGTDKINLPLSDARAKSVEQYFIENSGIAPERIQTVGYGPRIPLADNNSDAGRQDNRRVEIRPYGNIAAPRIATSGWLNAGTLRLSPDGRFAVTGNTPAQVWDVERMMRVHQLPIGGNTREISPNGRYIAMKSAFVGVTGTTDNRVYIYDMRTGLVHSQIPNDVFIDEIAWSPFSDAVAFSDQNGFLRVFDMPSREIRSVAKMGTIRGSEEITWVGDGDHIVTKVPRSSSAMVLDAKTLEPVKRLANTGRLHSLVSTKDGTYVVGMNNDYELIVWRTSDWAEVTRNKMPAMTFELVAHPSEQKVMILDAFTNATRLALIDVPSGRVVGRFEDEDRDTVLRGNFTPDGAYFVTAMDDKITYIDTNSMRIDRQKSGNTQRGEGLTMVPSQDMVLSRDEAGTSVWSVKTGRRVHRIKGAVQFAWEPLSQDGSVLFSFDEAGNMLRFDAATFRSETVMQVDGKPYSMQENDRYIAVGTVPSGDGPFRNPVGKVYVIEKSTLKTVMRKDFEIVSEPVNFPEIYDPRLHVRLAENGLVAATSGWRSGFKQNLTDGRVVTTYDPVQSREMTTFRAEDRYFQMEWGGDGEVLKFRGKGTWYLHDPKTGKQDGRETPKANYEIELSDGRTIDWFWDHVALNGKEINFPHTLRHLEVHEPRNVAVGLTTGNELIFIDLNTMEQALTIAPQQGDEWIAFTPDGRYTASLNGTDNVYWSLGDNYLPFSALSEQYERPSLIRNLLDAIAKGEALPEDGPDVDADVFEAPYQVSLISPAESTTEAETFTVELEVRKDNADLPDPEIEYTLNGRRVLKSRGFEEEAFFDGEETVGFTRRFDLNPGQNVIEASLVWREARIQTQRIEITRDSGVPPESRSAGKALWFFGVGVSDYERSSQNLNFAHRDAIELARLMEAQEGKLFGRVETKILTNEEASERNVRIQMNEFLDQAGDDDVIVLFLAGHGVVDAEQELFFMTHEGDLTKPYTGMSVNRFRDLLENRPLNQNALMLLDICHSGAGDGRVVAEDAVQDLTKGTGAVVFASSSGSELSYEDESFGGGHGAFTAALLEGLTGMADSRVGNRDGFNSLREIVLFTSSRVPEMTEGQQQPQIPVLARDADYRLSAVID